MGNLFGRFDKGSYCVLMGDLEDNYRLIDKSYFLPCHYYFTKFLHYPTKGWRRFRSLFKECICILKSARKGIEIVRRENVENIFLIPSYFEAFSALLVYWITRKRLIIYLPDIYYVPRRFGPGWSSLLMRQIEPILLKSAQTVLVTAEPTRDYYKQKYNIDAEILPHSVDLTRYKPHCDSFNMEKKETKILFTGEVSEAQLDSVLNMVKMVNSYNELNAKFVIATNAPKRIIRNMGIKCSERVVVTYADRKEIPKLQQTADILFIPLSFTWPNHEIITTASPSKMPEYLAAGRPILVHAPSYSYIARYARSKKFALIVDQLDLSKLYQAVFDLINNDKLTCELITNARKTAVEHNSLILSKKLEDILCR